MARERLYLFDTTLRDGAQTNGVDFTLNDKLAIARMLDELGIDYIEGGYPGANLTDTQLFAEERGLNATFTAFGMARRPGRSTSNDPGLAALLEAKADAICFVAKSWDYHVRVALETTDEENLASIRDSVRAAKAKGREVLLDCEHFFDGYKANPQFALACAKAAYDEGARWVVLCDTNGGALPREVERIVGEVVKVIPGSHVAIHAHNDTEQAVANSLAAVRAGARQIQGTLNGLAELERIGLKVDREAPRIARLLEVVKEREAIGYAYEAADASFELLARRVLGKVPSYFDVEKFDVTVEQRDNALGQRVTVSLAVVKVKVDGEHLISAAEGNGPVNALDLALRKDLGKYQSYISGLELTDYRVRILNGGTEAITRVLIESQDETGERWTTVGVSPNIIDASFQALMDSIIYKLVRSGA